jgi:hypothetical protein
MPSFDPIDVEQCEQNEFAQWEAKCKLVLPPKFVDGRIQVGGKGYIGIRGIGKPSEHRDDSGEVNDEVLTVGDSDGSTERSVRIKKERHTNKRQSKREAIYDDDEYDD